MSWCRDQESNQGHTDFQSVALPTELSRRKEGLHYAKGLVLVKRILGRQEVAFKQHCEA